MKLMRTTVASIVAATFSLTAVSAFAAASLTGAGATFPAPVYAKWADSYQKETGNKVNYQGIGSSGGVKQIVANTVDFGASDAPLSDDKLAADGLFQFPTVIGGVVLAVNIPGIKSGELTLDGKTLGDIYLGNVKKWNDPAITKLNPGVKLPDQNIAVVRRADGSGTSFVFTSYLSKANAQWKEKIGAGSTVNWPTGLGGKGNDGIAAFVQRLPGSIGYVEYARLQLATLERVFQSEQSEKLLLAGVMLLDPARFDLRGELVHGRDITIDANVIIEGHVKLGDRVKIGAGCVLKNCVIGDDCEISPYSVLEDSVLEADCTVGPFARLRPGAELAAGAHVGNFVEMKKARLGKGSKAGHLSYLGDAEIGDDVNIGAGTITCNYDGANKHKTLIGDGVFVGSDTQLVAPVSVGKGSTIAAGTTVTRDIAENELVLSRVKQVHIQGWQRPVKKKL